MEDGQRETTLYYFTGTGNSLACTRSIAAELGGAQLVSISSLRGAQPVRVSTTRVGVVFPVYFYTMPLIVREFLERLDLSQARYVFVVLTMGGMPGRTVQHAQESLAKAGGKLNAAFGIRMLGNYIAEYNVGDENAVQTMQNRMARDVSRIVGHIRAEREHLDRSKPASRCLGRLLSALLGGRFLATCRRRDQRFTVDAACTSCGTCVWVCPVANVRLKDDRPEWLGQCEQCFACIHFCPVEAIQIRGKRTRGRRRYHHPEVTVEDVARQRGGVNTN